MIQKKTNCNTAPVEYLNQYRHSSSSSTYPSLLVLFIYSSMDSMLVIFALFFSRVSRRMNKICVSSPFLAYIYGLSCLFFVILLVSCHSKIMSIVRLPHAFII